MAYTDHGKQALNGAFSNTLDSWTHIYLKTSDGIYLGRHERKTMGYYNFEIPPRYVSEYLVWAVGTEKNPFNPEILYANNIGQMNAHFVTVEDPGWSLSY